MGSDRNVESLPFKTQIIRGGEFHFGGRVWTPSAIVEKLKNHLTAERLARIEQVVGERTFSIATVAEGLYDIGNISAVMRSAESFGFMPFHIVERPGSRYKMSDRISKGSEKWLDTRKYVGPEACFQNLREQGFKIYATDLHATHNIEDIDFTQKVAVVFGNEKEGISNFVRENSDGRFIIPMRGFAQSFNISVAAALCFYHIHGERRRHLGRSGDLSGAEKENLVAHYILRTLDSAEAILTSAE
jgi:tRNA (guanosine-2'-O-)-methyltransferase